VSRGDETQGPFDPPTPDTSGEPSRTDFDRAANISTPPISSTDWWRASPRESAPQWSLLELFLLTTGAAATSGLTRLVPPVGVAAVLGTVVIFGWLRLHLEDWEPRWAVIAWRVALASYLTSILIAVLRR